MKIGEIIIADTISLVYFIYDIALHTIFFITSIYILIQIIIHLRQRFIDILKILQLISIFIWLIGRCISGLFVLVYPMVFSHIAVIIVNSINEVIFIHYWLNQLSWYVLIQHLSVYRQMADGKSYDEWQIKIKHKEKFGILFVGGIYILLTISAIAFWLLIYSNLIEPLIVLTAYFFEIL